MSERNVETVRHAVRHLSDKGEPDWSLYDPELVWATRRDGPVHNTYRGLDGLRRGIASMRDVWAEFSGAVVDTADHGDVVICVIRWQLRARSGVELEVEEGWATWFRDHKITRIEQHGSKQEALAAAGLSE
jgi:ketosteroid isomerase-like protein